MRLGCCKSCRYDGDPAAHIDGNVAEPDVQCCRKRVTETTEQAPGPDAQHGGQERRRQSSPRRWASSPASAAGHRGDSQHLKRRVASCSTSVPLRASSDRSRNRYFDHSACA
jgi:hypothetical protein